MTGFFAIARREVREHRLVLVAAAVASLGPAAVPLFHEASAAQARGVASFLGAFVLAAGIAIGLGATTLASGISTRRVGFDFARPLSAFAIWGGRLAGAVLLAAAAALIMWAPAAIAGATQVPWNDVWAAPSPPRGWPLLTLAGFATLFAIAHGAALALRSRSGLIVLDAAMILLSAFFVSAAFSRLPVYRAEAPSLRVGVGLAVAASVACLAAGYASVVRGRTDARAAHRALSSVLWTVIGAALVCANGYTAWVKGAKPPDLRQGFRVTPAAAGPWLIVSGPARGAEATFVYDAVAGRFERTLTADWRDPVLSRDGKRAAWIQAERRGPFPLWTWRLDVAGAQPVRTRILLEGYPYLMVLSEDGSRLATWENGMVSVHDIGEQRTLASARIPLGDQEELRGLFVSPDALRLYRVGNREIEILQLDVGARALARLGRIEGSGGRYFLTDRTGSRLLALDGPNSRVRLFDGATGALLATLAEDPVVSRWPALYPDGRIVLSERTQGGWRLRVFDTGGKEGASIPLPEASQITLGGEIAPGKLTIGVADESFHSNVWLVDLDGASVRQVAQDLRPVRTLGNVVNLGSEATKLFYGPGQRSLVRFDPLTGQRQLLLGTR